MSFSSTCLIMNVAHRPVHHSTIHDCLDDDHACQDLCDLSAALYATLCYSRSGMHPLLSSSNRLPQLLHQRGWTRYHLSAQLVLLDNNHNKYWNMQHGYYCLPSTVHSMAAIRDRLETDTTLYDNCYRGLHLSPSSGLFLFHEAGRLDSIRLLCA